jgi:hypothetical protein
MGGVIMKKVYILEASDNGTWVKVSEHDTIMEATCAKNEASVGKDKNLFRIKIDLRVEGR